MTHTRGTPQFGSWSVPQCRIVIEYDLDVLEDIRHSAYRAFERREIEIAGLLFGTYDGVQLRILEYRQFHLPGGSMDTFADQLVNYDGEGLPEGQGVVGWYHLCKRSGSDLPPEDIAFHEQNFPESWHVALLLRPDSAGAVQSRFFLREPRAVPSPAPAAESLTAVTSSPGPVRPVRETPAPVVAHARTAARDVTLAAQYEQSRQVRSSKIIWGILGVMAALAIGALYYLHNYSTAVEKKPVYVRLDVVNRGGGLELTWDPKVFGGAVRGDLEVRDGAGNTRLPLDPAILNSGQFHYTPVNDVTAFRLSVQGTNGSVLEGSTTYVMPATQRAATEPPPTAAAEAEPQATGQTPGEVLTPDLAQGRRKRKRPARAEPMEENTAARARTPKTAAAAPAPVAPADTTARTRPSEPVKPPSEPVQTAQNSPRLAVPVPSQGAPFEAPPLPGATSSPPAAAPRTSQAAPGQQQAVPRPAAPAPPPQQTAAVPVQQPRANLAGRWSLQSGGYSRSPAVPESIAVNVEDSGGAMRGTLEARYRNKNKTEKIRFSFAGQAGNGAVRLPWTGSSGERGQIEFIRVPGAPNTVEIVWYGADSKQVFNELLTRAK